MRQVGGLVLAALLCTAAVPAFAALEPVGSVNFTIRNNSDSTFARFRAHTVALTARGCNVFCRNVDASFANGGSRSILQREMLRAGEPMNIGLPGGVRNVRRLDFNCRPT